MNGKKHLNFSFLMRGLKKKVTKIKFWGCKLVREGNMGFLRLFSEKSLMAVMEKGTSNAKAFYRLHPVSHKRERERNH
jgi:hypothetical protein